MNQKELHAALVAKTAQLKQRAADYHNLADPEKALTDARHELLIAVAEFIVAGHRPRGHER